MASSHSFMLRHVKPCPLCSSSSATFSLSSSLSSPHSIALHSKLFLPKLSPSLRLLSSSSSPRLWRRRNGLRPLHLPPCSSKRQSKKQQEEDEESNPFWEGLDEEEILREECLTEEEAKRDNWVKRRWAPWEEVRNPEVEFAIDSKMMGGRDPVVSEELFRSLSNKELRRNYYSLPQMEPKPQEEGEEAEPEVINEKSYVYALIPPRDWPPPGWEVDPKELAFIREAHVVPKKKFSIAELESAPTSIEGAVFERWNTFVKQYEHWAAANKDRLEKEALELEQDYYPGRRKTGSKYEDGMYELPFIYPGQHYRGEVVFVHLYEGAFIDYGGAHDGWVPIRDNDWYEIRNHIKVGMQVEVEVVARRDPYRFRFPVEMRFANPNIDHLIFKRFDTPPIFVYQSDTDLDEVARESGRAYWPRPRPEGPARDLSNIPNHPYIPQLWKIHMAEQMLLDEEEGPEAFYSPEGDLLEDIGSDFVDEMESQDSTWTDDFNIGDVDIPLLSLVQAEEDELDLDAACTERKSINQLVEDANSRGELLEIPTLKREAYIEELNEMHRQRFLLEDDAIIRDRSCRMEFGLPLEEPGRYVDRNDFYGNVYDPRQARWRHDFIGDPTEGRRRGGRSRARPAPEPAPVSAEGEDGENGFLSELIILQEGESILEDEEEESSESTTDTNETRLVNGTESLKIDTKGMFDTQNE